MTTNNIISALKTIFSNSAVLHDEVSKTIYGKDLTSNYNANPIAVVFPTTENQIISLVKLANTHNIKLVPSGGRTGYSGGAVAANGEVVVSFDKMKNIVSFDPGVRQVTCEPGVTTKQIQDYALENGLFYPVNFASSGTSQMGGNVATNAGGIKVIRYGLTRNWVSGLRVVTGAGEVMSLNHGLIKNAGGYDLRHLFIGSEGTLGFITQITLQLEIPPPETQVLLLAVTDNSKFIDILNIFREKVTITAFEFFSNEAIQHVISETGLKHPFTTKALYYVLVEYEANSNNNDIVAETTQTCIDNAWIVDALLSSNIKQAETFWKYRESISMSLAKFSPYKYDIAVLPSKVANFMRDIDTLFHAIYPDFNIIWFGHIGDGNLHLNILKPDNITKNDFFTYCDNVSKKVFEIIQQYEGAISAEHGVGLLKKNYLHYSKSAVEIEYMRAIKKVFDPNNIMNPGKVV